MLASREPSPHPARRTGLSNQREVWQVGRRGSALCSDSRCFQSLTGCCELLLRVKGSGRWAGTRLSTNLVVSLWGCQVTKRPGLGLASSLLSSQPKPGCVPKTPGPWSPWSWQGSWTVAQCEVRL